MLQVIKILPNVPPQHSAGDLLFEENPNFRLVIKAPIYWWVDCDWIKYSFNMPLSDFEFELDAFQFNEVPSALEELAHKFTNVTERKIMQLLPLSAYMTGVIELSYREIVEVCENYVSGEYTYVKGYGFPNEREWADFCETLLDGKGIRDLVKEEK